jgi:hypothetical protein
LSFRIVRGQVHEYADAPHALALLRTRGEWPRGGRAAERGQQFPPSDGDCHAPLPREVRKGNDTTSRAYSLAVQGGQDAGCFHRYSRRQLLANAAIAASRVAS